MIRDVQVNQEQCMGCGGCETTCSGVFRLTYKVHAEVHGKNFEKHRKKMLAAYYGCPLQAIELNTDDPSLLVAWHAACVIEKTRLSETTLQVRLKTALSDFKPGQYVTVRFKDPIGAFNRAYSIVDLHDGILTLCVTLVEGGRGSAFFDTQNVGSELEITDPKGEFYLRETKSAKVFVGTGAGLAPLLPMMEACPDVPKTLYFGQRNEREIFYLDRLEKIPNLDVNICLDFADDDWAGLRGRVTEFVRDAPLKKDTEVYTCGNDAMMNDLEKGLKKRRHPKKLFFKESFSSIGAATLSEAALLRRVWIRNIHIYTSLLFCLLFLFFGLSGFMAGRPELFPAETLHLLPANIEIEKGELSGFYKAKFGKEFSLTDYSRDGDYSTVELCKPDQTTLVIELDHNDRSYLITEYHPLPPALVDLEAEALVVQLSEQLKGKLDPDSIEPDEDVIYFNLESVWSKSAVTVVRAEKNYEISRETVPWAKSLILIHKGKETASYQKTIMDATAWAMILTTFTGMIMVFQSKNPQVRVVATVLFGLSLVLIVALIFNR